MLRRRAFCGRMSSREIRRGKRSKALLRQVLLGGAISAAIIAIHALTMLAVVHAGRAALAKRPSRPAAHLVLIMVVTVAILMAAHVAEVVVWSLAYAAVDVVPAGADPLYFAFVNYTTLGYGDVVPVERWRLIGPITAMNGVLMFGWSTAVIFEVLRTAIRATHGDPGPLPGP
jgi:hypothetical protein